MKSKKKKDSFDYNLIETGYYDRIYRKNSGIQSKWHHLKFSGIHKMLYNIECRNLLDIGCGPGTFISTLPEEIQSIGIDISSKQIKFAHEHHLNGRSHFLIGSGFSLPFPDGRFDVITSIEFIEHIPISQIRQVFKEIRRCLVPGGTFLVTTPNYELTWPALEWMISKLSNLDYTEQHKTKFNKTRITDLLEESGFKDIRVRKYLFMAPFLAALSWSLASKIFELEFNTFTDSGNLLLAVSKT